MKTGKRIRRIWITSLLIAVLPAAVFGQLERERVVTGQPTELTFMAPKNINLYTVEPLAGGELHYSIMHTFGKVTSGAGELWGLDRGANIRFSFEYGISDRLSVGVGRSGMDKVYDLHGRFALLRQADGGNIPFSVSLVPSAGITTGRYGFLENGYSFSERIHFAGSLPVARKFNEALSLQLVPLFAHFNRVGPELNVADPLANTSFRVGAGGRYKITPGSALTFQLVPPLAGAEKQDWNIAVGIDIETGGHVFQMFFTTSNALNESYLAAGENGNFWDGEFRFGFNVNRLFRIR